MVLPPLKSSGNILLGFPNRIQPGVVLSGGQWEPTLPLDFMVNRELFRVSRSVDLETNHTTFTVDLGQARLVRLMAFVNHNFSLSAKVRVEASTDGNFDPQPGQDPKLAYDATFEAWGSLVNSMWMIDELNWEDDNYWLGTYNKDDLIGMTAVSSHIMPGQAYAQYWRFTIMDETNPDGFVQFGRLFLGDAFQPRINYSMGSSLSYEDPSGVETSLGGSEYFDKREPIRVFRFTLSRMKNNEAYGRILELVRRSGITEEIFVVPDPNDNTNGQRRNFMGRIRVPGPLEQTMWADGGQAHAMTFELREIR